MADWRRVAETWADGMMEAGAGGVALMGSHTRGDNERLSDVDIVGVGEGDAKFLLVDGVIVSSSWVTPVAARESFTVPDRLGFTVPGWRTAVPLRDPNGEVEALRADALAWTWTDERERAGRAYLANQVTGYCEEVFLLVRMIDRREWPAAVIRSVFSLRSAALIAARYGVLYESEKDLWERVAARQGPEWTTLQAAALGLGGVTPRESALAGLGLYRLLAEVAGDDLSDDQRPVVELALTEIAAITS